MAADFLQVVKRKEDNPLFGLQWLLLLLFFLVMKSQKGEMSFPQEMNSFCIPVIFRKEGTWHGSKNLKLRVNIFEF